ncbi:response regulator, partial [Candidatus Ozemobacteraceae bacterium]|nr:response regulator [Candidatus Ozemobacteraceae bacterium]
MRQAKPSVLFVDSDQSVLDGMRRLILDRRLEWLTYYVKTPREALESIVNFPPDVIIADLFLPPIYGETLLEIARRAHPEIVRMILSTEADRESEQFLRSTQSAQQFLTKPCRIEELETAVQRALNLRQLLRQPRLVRIIG